MQSVRAEGKYDRTRGQGHADRGQSEDSGALLNLGGRDWDGFGCGLTAREGEGQLVGGRASLYLGGEGWREVRAGRAALAACIQGSGWLGAFSLAWSGRRSGIGGLMLPSLPKREVTAKKGSK